MELTKKQFNLRIGILSFVGVILAYFFSYLIAPISGNVSPSGKLLLFFVFVLITTVFEENLSLPSSIFSYVLTVFFCGAFFASAFHLLFTNFLRDMIIAGVLYALICWVAEKHSINSKEMKVLRLFAIFLVCGFYILNESTGGTLLTWFENGPEKAIIFSSILFVFVIGFLIFGYISNSWTHILEKNKNNVTSIMSASNITWYFWLLIMWVSALCSFVELLVTTL